VVIGFVNATSQMFSRNFIQTFEIEHT